jgi:hypothetical protein
VGWGRRAIVKSRMRRSNGPHVHSDRIPLGERQSPAPIQIPKAALGSPLLQIGPASALHIWRGLGDDKYFGASVKLEEPMGSHIASTGAAPCQAERSHDLGRAQAVRRCVSPDEHQLATFVVWTRCAIIRTQRRKKNLQGVEAKYARWCPQSAST